MTLPEARHVTMLDLAPALATAVDGGRRLRRQLKRAFCVLNGGHELYPAHSSTRLFQRCLLCGHETRGWDLAQREKP